MKINSQIAVVCALACCVPAHAQQETLHVGQSGLVTMTGNGEFVEVERTADHSLVEVRKAPQGSVASSIYTLRGVCAVLMARGAKYVTSLPVASSVPTYRLEFPEEVSPKELSGVDKSVFSSADCAALRF